MQISLLKVWLVLLKSALSTIMIPKYKYKEPVMIYATANTDHYIPIRNLSTTHKHYTTGTDLCSTARSTCRTYCNLPTAIDPSLTVFRETPPEPLTVLARQLYIPFDHTTTVGLPYSLTRHIAICPPTNTEPCDPILIFGRLMPNLYKIRHQSWLDHYEPFTLHIISCKSDTIHGKI